MRTLFIFLAFAMSILTATAQVHEETKDLDHEDFNKNYLQFFKKVKSVKVFEKSNIHAPNRDMDKIDFRIVERKQIDKEGRVTSIMYYSYFPESQHRYFFEYDSTSLLSCQKINLANEKVHQWNFNSDTLVVEEIKYSSGVPKFSWKYRYDENENLVEVTKIKSSGKVARRIHREYDSLNRMVSYQLMKGNGKVKFSGELVYRDTTESLLSSVNWKKGKILDKSLYKYDSIGNLLRLTELGKGGVFKSQTHFEYDSLNRKILAKLMDVNSDTPGPAIRLEYDEYDRVISETIENHLGVTIQENEFEYNAFNQVKFKRVKNFGFYGPQEILFYNDYDMNGNILEERIESMDTNHKVIRKHEYEYYSNDEIVME